MEKKVRTPKQQRSREQVEKIKIAAYTLFCSKGYYHVSTNEIAKEAKVSIGTFYSYYKDKKDVFMELLEDYGTQITNQLEIPEDALHLELQELITMLVHNITKAHHLQPQFHKQMILMMQTDKDIKKLVDSYETKTIDKIELLLKCKVKEKENLRELAYLIYKNTESIIHEIKVFGCDYEENLLLQYQCDMIIAFLESKMT